MTWAPSPAQLAAALVHAGRCAPAECCGVVADGRFLPITNRATEFDSFILDGREYAVIAGRRRVEAIVHSHVNLPSDPSDADRAMCEKLGLPWLIVAWPNGVWRVLEPCGWKAPLVGRQWAWGAQDCLAIIRDGLSRHAGIELPDFPRDWLFWQQGQDPIADNFAAAGFRRMPAGEPPKHCDVLGMKVNGAPVANHLALFLAPDQILHQFVGRLSRRQLYDGPLQKMTVLHLRHERLQ